jgi:hypothetical protein
MRPNASGWVILAFFLVAGITVWVAKPDFLLGPGWVACAVLGGLYFLFMNRRADAEGELVETGIRGTAQILEATETGMYVNNYPRVKLKLLVDAPGVPPFEDTTTQTVPLLAIGRLTSGTPLTIYLKPEEPHDYVIDWS